MTIASAIPVQIGALDVPGGSLHYEVMGTGPALLFIPGGASDASGFLPMGERLAGRFTVVRYDPRGISRSALPAPVGGLIAHEPPLTELLPVDDRWRGDAQAIHAVYQEQGPEADMMHVMRSAGMDGPPRRSPRTCRISPGCATLRRG